MKKTSKYTKEILEPVVIKSKSVADIIRHFDLRFTGGSYSSIKRLIVLHGLDTSHFTGAGWNAGLPSRNKKDFSHFLVLRDKSQAVVNSHYLRRALIESGVLEVCHVCGSGPVWNSKPLRLQIDHINGRKWDNRKENLRFLCPNCHSQTDNFGNRNTANVA